MTIFYLKAFHIVGFVAWLAGLFYLVRIFVYHREALDQEEPKRSILSEQYRVMEQRAYKIICQPAMMLTWTCGIAMLAINPGYFQQSWIHVKLLFLVGLTGYHVYCKYIVKNLEQKADQLQDIHYRIMNEVPSVLLLIIVLLAVFRQNINYVYLGAGVVLFTAMIAWGIYGYQKKRREGSA